LDLSAIFMIFQSRNHLARVTWSSLSTPIEAMRPTTFEATSIRWD
jgi:hypothetical protein